MRPAQLEGALQVPSANQSTRSGPPVALGVLHYTGAGNGRATAQWLATREARRSYHLLIDRLGAVFQLVPFTSKAWHAGISECTHPDTRETEGDVNQWSIGIAFANWGLLYRDKAGRFYGRLGGTLVDYRHAQPIQRTLTFDNGAEAPGWWEPYTDAQIRSGAAVCRKLLELGWVKGFTGHEGIGMPLGRKLDPGPLFPWGRIPHRLPPRTAAIP